VSTRERLRAWLPCYAVGKMRLAIASSLLLLASCDASADGAVEKSKQAAGELASQAGDKASALAGEAGGKAKSLWDDLPSTGELSDSASGWISEQAKSAGGGIEAAIVKGKQLGPEALDIGSNLRKAVDSDTAIEPIYQEVEDGGRTAADVDAAIGDMPRKEVIEGVTVGFKRMDELSEQRSLKERGYLVMWRQGDHLVGFVYRSRREIDIEKMVAEAPRLVKLVQTATD
jgi:hypothetical protein